MKPETTVSPVIPKEGAAQGKGGSKALTVFMDLIITNVL